MVFYAALVLVLLVRPNGLFGRRRCGPSEQDQIASPKVLRRFGGLTGLRLAGVVVLLAGALAFPVVFSNPVDTNYGVFALIFVAVASAWNIFSGFSGYISLGHAVFFGSGAYALGIAARDWHSPGSGCSPCCRVGGRRGADRACRSA